MDRISSLEQEISEIRKSLNEKEAELYALKKQLSSAQSIGENVPEDYALANNSRVQIDKLPRWAIERYSRQILLTNIGVAGQEKLCAAKVLIVGAGGLGCPAAMYLAGAGIGEIGIVDYDTVDLTNIHRQVLHGESDQNLNKVDSAANALRNINSRITITPYNVLLDSSNAANIVSKYDIVLDCTDNVPTRYLLNDVCVITKLPLISGSALQMEGQITIYGYRDRNPNEKEAYAGPCYRCVFPSPPPPHAVRSCSAHGVAGPVPALVGALQALETIKYIVGQTRDKLLVGRMLLFDGEDSTFRTVKLRGQNPECAACSANPTITKLIDYEQFCKTQAKEKDLDLHILPEENRISATELAQIINDTSSQRHLLVDVRTTPEFHMCKIDGAVNYSIEESKKLDGLVEEIRNGKEVIFVCRRGNDSQIVAKRVLDLLGPAQAHRVKDLTGGLHAWAKHVDPEFPVY